MRGQRCLIHPAANTDVSELQVATFGPSTLKRPQSLALSPSLFLIHNHIFQAALFPPPLPYPPPHGGLSSLIITSVFLLGPLGLLGGL